MKELQYVVENHIEVIKYLKSRYPMYHRSNFFFRDIQFGIQTMMEERGISLSYAEAERIARALAVKLEREKILLPRDHQTWVVSYEEFQKPQVRAAAPARSSGPAPAVAGAATPPRPGSATA